MKLFLILFLLTSYSIYSNNLIDESSVLIFSPNNDGIKDEAIIKLKTSSNDVDVSHLAIYKNDKLLLSIKGKKHKDKLIYRWDGLKRNNKSYIDGNYIAIFKSDNQEKDYKKEIKITIDTKRPTSSISCKNVSISPNYDGKNDSIKISQDGSVEKSWEGFIKDQNDKKVKSFKWFNSSPKNFIWDGKSDFGRIVKDGKYIYELSSIDEAGNKSKEAVIENIIVDGSTPKVKLTADNHYISPNGDSIKDNANVHIVGR